MKIDRVKLIAEMARQRISVAKLAELSHLSRSSITCIRGGKSCNASTAFAIAEALCVDVAELLEGV